MRGFCEGMPFAGGLFKGTAGLLDHRPGIQYWHPALPAKVHELHASRKGPVAHKFAFA